MTPSFRSLIVSALVCSPAARGDVILDFVFSHSAAFVAPNGTAEIPLYLRETVSSPDTSLLVGEDGLASAGVRVWRSSAGAPDAATFAISGGIIPSTIGFADALDPLFAPVIINAPDRTATAMLLFAAGPAQGVLGDPASPNVRLVYVGSVRITVGSVEGQTTVFTAGDFDTLSDDTITWRNLQTLDPQIRPGILEVVVTPSPGISVVLGIGAFAATWRRQRRERFTSGRSGSSRFPKV